jgi:DNA transformation protein and related proteins
MPIDDSLAQMLVDELAPLGHVVVRRMFGGGGVFIDGLMIGLIADDQLYLKVDDALRPRFEAAGLVPFTYSKKTGNPVVMNFWQAPDSVLDDPDELRDWGAAALAAARRVHKRATRRSEPRRARR